MTDSLPARRRAPGAPSQAPGADAFLFDEVERATGSPTIPGNRLCLQFEGPATFEAWMEAIEGAKRFVYFENYVIRGDRVGRAFREVLIRKARSGVPVRLIYDWLGCWATPRSYWKPMRAAGVEVRAFNRPALGLGNPLGALQRDHRKLVVVDGEVSFIGGFCVGDEWAGSDDRPPWRDTGVELRGPAVHAAARAFESLWNQMGPSPSLLDGLGPAREVGDTPVWLVEGEPGRARVYRTIHLAATKARRRIWITDAYFVAPRPIAEALAAAALDGVDVRILLPAHNNWPWVGSLSRAGYRYLLEAGVRIFEWQGPMIHAKTAVVDGVWCRVGSSNMNAASLMGNWELDVGILDEELGGQLEGLFLADLASSSEIVLPRAMVAVPAEAGTYPELSVRRRSLDPQGSLPRRIEQEIRARGETRGHLTMASVLRAGVALGDALAGDRPLGREDRVVLGTLSALVLAVAAVAALFPAFVGGTVAVVAGWFGITMAIRAYLQALRGRALERALAAARVTGDGGPETEAEDHGTQGADTP